MDKNKISAVDVYLQRRISREYVGRLKRKGGLFVFSYDERYLFSDRALALGPDLPLTKKVFKSRKLFPTFEDRIPLRANPVYPEYCQWVGISVDERDPMVLLSTLGQKGPSSFVFAPAKDAQFGPKDLIQFRKNLGLSIREFAELFDFGPATIHRIESGKSSGKDALKRIEIYCKFPRVALFELSRSGCKIGDRSKERAAKALEAMGLEQDRVQG